MNITGMTFEVRVCYETLKANYQLKKNIMKKRIVRISTLALLISGTMLMSCNNNASTESEKKDSTGNTSTTESNNTGPKTAVANITGTKSDTAVNGTATFTEADGKTKLELSVTIPKMANKSVAVHIHEHGDCGDAGKNTHGHWNPGGKQHGKWGTGDFHLGDIGNVSLDGEGKGTLTMDTDLWSVGGDANKDVSGKAIIVHSGVDDYKTQPTGNAGSRIGCGLIEKK